MPARGFANRSRAALGHRSAGKKTGPYGAYLTRDSFSACRQKHRAAASRGNPGLGLSHRGDSRWRVPWRSAGRRARLSNRAALPRKRQLARQCAFRRFASLLCLGGFSGVVVMSKTRTCESVARAIIYFVIASVSEAIQGGWRGAGLLRRWRSSQ
jgi:hypothetical protein